MPCRVGVQLPDVERAVPWPEMGLLCRSRGWCDGPVSAIRRPLYAFLGCWKAPERGWERRAARRTYGGSFQSQNKAQDEGPKTSAYGALPYMIAPLPTPGPLSRSRPPEDPSQRTGKHLQDPALTASLRAGCVTAANRQAGACRGKRGAIKTNIPTRSPTTVTPPTGTAEDPTICQRVLV